MNQHAYFVVLLFICLNISTTHLLQQEEVGAQHYPRQHRPQKYPPQQPFDYGGVDGPDYGTGDQQSARNVAWGSAARPPARISDFLSSASRLLQGSMQQKASTPRHSSLNLVENWPNPRKLMGQLSAVDLDSHGNVLVFHRGDRVWNQDTFSPDNKYLHEDWGPIRNNTIVVFNSSTGEVVKEWGSSLFYMPHGLTVDFEDNVWVTDVALHQVLKFSPGGGTRPLLALGGRFTPSSDRGFFCKPTDVAVMKTTGDFFVSDGYCNSRIIKFSKNGTWILQWGRSTLYAAPPPNLHYSFNVPHALALAEDRQQLCVADRENGRVLCYNCHNASFVLQIQSKSIGSKIYGVAYTKAQGGLLYLINSPENARVASGFAVNMTSLDIVEQFPIGADWSAQPHDIAVSANGGQVYVVELSNYRVWKFVKDDVNSSSVEMDKISLENSDSPTAAAAAAAAAASLVQNNPSKGVFNATVIKEDGKFRHTEATSVAAALGVIIGATAVIGIVVLVVLFKLKRKGCASGGYSEHRDRWEFPVPPVEGFKFSQFLDRHQGFEKVSTEESDDEGASGIAMATHRAQYA
ncbi:peptidyl-alpha-hydroxyglycine alpha-amidating lyase 2 isoform X2 [Bacillus rossius redtenbacheri]